jgi:hypothetical protein
VDGRALLGVITAVYEDEPYAHMIPITSIFSGIESMLSKDSKRAKIEMIAYGRPNARKHDLISNETTSEPSVDKKVWLAKNQIDVQLEALFPRFLMALAIGLVGGLFQAISHQNTNLTRTLRHIHSFCHMK